MSLPELIVRPLEPQDVHYITSCWHHALVRMERYKGKDQAKAHAEIQEHLDWLLDNCVVTIAAPRIDPEHIMGFSIIAPDGELVWTYTRKAYWCKGIQKALLNGEQLKQLKEQL